MGERRVECCCCACQCVRVHARVQGVKETCEREIYVQEEAERGELLLLLCACFDLFVHRQREDERGGECMHMCRE